MLGLTRVTQRDARNITQGRGSRADWLAKGPVRGGCHGGLDVGGHVRGSRSDGADIRCPLLAANLIDAPG